MISRRSFLFYSSLTPWLAFLGLPSASATTAGALSAKPNQLEGRKSAELVIEGWHEQDSDLSKAQLISLSPNWKSTWL